MSGDDEDLIEKKKRKEKDRLAQAREGARRTGTQLGGKTG
jgi:hypothetical protein